MMIEENVMQLIQQQTQQIADFLQRNSLPNDYGSQALKELEAYIDDRRHEMATDERNTLHVLIGAFFGECLRRAYSGEWIGIGEEGSKQLGLQVDGTLTLLPFVKVGKYIADPKFNSFVALFTNITPLLNYLKAKKVAANGETATDSTVRPHMQRLTNPKYVMSLNRDVKIVEALLQDGGITNDYGAIALNWLENLMEENRYGAVGQYPHWFLEGIGAFLGECLCRHYDGVWIEHELGLGIQILDGKLLSFPFSKVTKFIQDGSGDSFVTLFALIPAMKTEALKRASE